MKLKVMSFNLRGSITTAKDDGINCWDNRKAQCVDLIKRCKPDLIGFQEFQTMTKTDGNFDVFIKDLKDYHYFIGPKYNNEPPFCYPIIFWNPCKVELIECGGFWLGDNPQVHEKCWDTAYIRSAGWCVFRDLASGSEFLMSNTHLDNVSVLARSKGAQLICEKLQEKVSDMPIILTGDFNCGPESEPYSIFLNNGFEDTFAKFQNDFDETYTYHAFKGQETTEGRIDWILTKAGKNGFACESFEIVRDAKPPVYPSDHFPVTAELTL